jgi:hypothetical protein
MNDYITYDKLNCVDSLSNEEKEYLIHFYDTEPFAFDLNDIQQPILRTNYGNIVSPKPLLPRKE